MSSSAFSPRPLSCKSAQKNRRRLPQVQPIRTARSLQPIRVAASPRLPQPPPPPPPPLPRSLPPAGRVQVPSCHPREQSESIAMVRRFLRVRRRPSVSPEPPTAATIFLPFNGLRGAAPTCARSNWPAMDVFGAFRGRLRAGNRPHGTAAHSGRTLRSARTSLKCRQKLQPKTGRSTALARARDDMA